MSGTAFRHCNDGVGSPVPEYRPRRPRTEQRTIVAYFAALLVSCGIGIACVLWTVGIVDEFRAVNADRAAMSRRIGELERQVEVAQRIAEHFGMAEYSALHDLMTRIDEAQGRAPAESYHELITINGGGN